MEISCINSIILSGDVFTWLIISSDVMEVPEVFYHFGVRSIQEQTLIIQSQKRDLEKKMPS